MINPSTLAEYKNDFISKFLPDFNDQNLFHKFIDITLNSLVDLDFLSLEDRVIWNTLLKMFEFLTRKEYPQNEIVLSNLSYDTFTPVQDEQVEKFFSCLLANVIDTPFIVDSFLEEIRRVGHNIIYQITILIQTIRDQEGNLIQVFPITNNIPKPQNTDHIIQNEALLFFEVSDIVSADIRNNIVHSVKEIYREISISVMDWKKHLIKVQDISSNYQTLLSTQPNNTNLSEAYDFLSWLQDHSFIFLGFAEFAIKTDPESVCFIENTDSSLGLCRLHPGLNAKFIDDITKINIKHLHDVLPQTPFFISIEKSNIISKIHRRVHFDLIRVQKFDNDFNVIGEYRFYGLFTSLIHSQPVEEIPIIKQKISYINDSLRIRYNSYRSKELTSALNAYPRDALLQINQATLYEHCLRSITASGKNKIRLLVNYDRFGRFVHCIIYVPKNLLDTYLIQKSKALLEETYSADVTEEFIHMNEFDLAKIELTLTFQNLNNEFSNHHDSIINQIENNLNSLTNLWNSEILAMFRMHEKYHELDHIHQIYANAFPRDYVEKFSSSNAFEDIFKIQEAITQNQAIFKVIYDEILNQYQINLYIPNQHVPLSRIMPMLESFYLEILEEQLYIINPAISDTKGKNKKLWLYAFYAKKISNNNLPDEGTFLRFEETLNQIWTKHIITDPLNSLILNSQIDWRYLKLLRSYAKYLKQIQSFYDLAHIIHVLTKNTTITTLLIKLFIIKFDPQLENDIAIERNEQLDDIRKEIAQAKLKVININEDNVIQQILTVIESTVRTNFYQQLNNNSIDYISIKIDSSKLSKIPLPKPYKEIFVYANYMEGIHLRGGKIARGGLRWSDRHEDYRTEIHGLAKAQMTKNSVIIPVGSKGGFVIKSNTEHLNRTSLREEAIRCYKTLLNGMISITDNIIDGKIVPPQNVITYDESDPYLVVAADKGTATFSDIANEVAREHNFWLFDAFASGGSNGYDHKKMGITAKGAWIAVQRHFLEIGVDIQNESIKIVGIGGMSGDVFGNGMLLSGAIKLVASFDHMHIFIDPNPDPETSYAERLRLFQKPQLSWQDYNAELISAGGGVFERGAKSITITPEMQQLLKITDTKLSGVALINSILKAPIDLIWNGGIGTYIKSSSESHADVKDHANDTVRVDASEVRAKVIGEGGNLGLTQNARIEYALNGNKINTDALDNSAGVDCSDHEVNIKISLNLAMQNHLISYEERNILLEKMTDEVEKLVLKDNILQTLAISIALFKSHRMFDDHRDFIEYLRKLKFLNPKVESLPDDDIARDRKSQKIGLTRPELCVLLSYSKMYLYQELLNINLSQDLYFKKYIREYFPDLLINTIQDKIYDHQLNSEIIATAISNEIVNRVGITFYYKIHSFTDADYYTISKNYLIVKELFDLESIWDNIESLNGKVNSNIQLEIYNKISNLTQKSVIWFIENHDPSQDIQTSIKQFQESINFIKNNITQVITPSMLDSHQTRSSYYINNKIPQELAQKISVLSPLVYSFYAIKISLSCNIELDLVIKQYFKIGSILHLKYLLRLLQPTNSKNKWQKQSYENIFHKILKYQYIITEKMIQNTNNTCDKTSNTDQWQINNSQHIALLNKLVTTSQSSDITDESLLHLMVSTIEKTTQ